MTTAHLMHATATRKSRGATIASLRGTAAAASASPLQSALVEIVELKRALLRSQREAAATRDRASLLASANAHLERVAFHRHFTQHLMPQRGDWVPSDFLLADGLDPEELSLLERLYTARMRVQKGFALYRLGAAFDSLFAISTGSCKTLLLGRSGQEQVAGYHISGDIIGIDGIAQNVHECEAIALEDMEVFPLTFDRLEVFARFSDRFRYNFQRLLSQECSRVQRRSFMLGTMCSDMRLAGFLLELSARYSARGVPTCEFSLRMTRDEIGSYLGLKLETISRAFSRFQGQGVLQVQGRLIKLLDKVALRRIAEGD